MKGFRYYTSKYIAIVRVQFSDIQIILATEDKTYASSRFQLNSLHEEKEILDYLSVHITESSFVQYGDGEHIPYKCILTGAGLDGSDFVIDIEEEHELPNCLYIVYALVACMRNEEARLTDAVRNRYAGVNISNADEKAQFEESIKTELVIYHSKMKFISKFRKISREFLREFHIHAVKTFQIYQCDKCCMHHVTPKDTEHGEAIEEVEYPPKQLKYDDPYFPEIIDAYHHDYEPGFN